jgi:hypothetical protein
VQPGTGEKQIKQVKKTNKQTDDVIMIDTFRIAVES